MPAFQITVTFDCEDRDQAEGLFDTVLAALGGDEIDTIVALADVPGDSTDFLIDQWAATEPVTIALPHTEESVIVTEIPRCVLCRRELEPGTWGNNPAPLADHGRACDTCNRRIVIPARMSEMGLQ